MKKLLIILSIIFSVSTVGIKAQQWDAVNALQMVEMLIQDGQTADYTLVNELGYTLINNYPDGDGFITSYIRNVQVDINTGKPISLSNRGVSSMVAFHYELGDLIYNAAFFFTPTNATKFRNQFLELGFKKTGTSRGITTYSYDDEIIVKETSTKVGRFTLYSFHYYLP